MPDLDGPVLRWRSMPEPALMSPCRNRTALRRGVRCYIFDKLIMVEVTDYFFCRKQI
jgi:hypothetical protein